MKKLLILILIIAICGCVSQDKAINEITTTTTSTIVTTSSTSTTSTTTTTTTVPSVILSLNGNLSNLTVYVDTQGFQITVTNNNTASLYNLTLSAITTSGNVLKTIPEKINLKPLESEEVLIRTSHWLLNQNDTITVSADLPGCDAKLLLDVAKNRTYVSERIAKSCTCGSK